MKGHKLDRMRGHTEQVVEEARVMIDDREFGTLGGDRVISGDMSIMDWVLSPLVKGVLVYSKPPS